MGACILKRAGRRSLLVSALLVACGSRSGLLSGGEDPIFGPSHAGAGGATATGGTPMSAGTSAQGGTSATGGKGGGGKGGGGKSSGGKGPKGGDFAIAGETTAEGGEFPLPQGGETSPSFAGAASDFSEPVEVIWGKRFGDSQAEQTALAIAVEPIGTFTLTGTASGNIDFGGGKLPGGGGTDAFIAQFDSDGTARWSAIYGDGGSQDGRGVAVADDGLISLVGNFSGTMTFGAGMLQSQGGLDVYLAQFKNDGTFQRAQRFGSADNQTANGLAMVGGEAPVWVGAFRGEIDPGGELNPRPTPLVSNGSVDAIIAGCTHYQACLWGIQGGNALAQRANAIAASNGDNSVFVVGNMLGQLKFGACSQLTGSATTEQGFLAWIDGSGSGNCNRTMALSGGASQALAVATGKSPLSQLVAMGGHFVEELTFGGVTVVNPGDRNDAYVALLEGRRDSYSFTQLSLIFMGGSGDQEVTALSFDSQDNLVVVGNYDGETTGADLPTSPSSFSHAFVMKYDSGGHRLWTKGFGDDTGNTVARAVGVDSDDNIYVAGSFEGTMPLTSGTLESAGKDDIFVVKLAP